MKGVQRLSLKHTRQQSGLKVKKIAECLEVSRTHYYNLEKGITKIDSSKMKKLATLFGMSLIDLKKIIEEDTNE